MLTHSEVAELFSQVARLTKAAEDIASSFHAMAYAANRAAELTDSALKTHFETLAREMDSRGINPMKHAILALNYPDGPKP